MTSLVLLLGATLARASAPVALDVDLARDLGDGLFSSGDAAGALQWYRVARWLEPTADELPGVQIRIALALEANGALTEAIGWYQRIDDGDVDFARLREGICISRNGAPSRGDVVLRELATAVPEDAPQVDLIRGTLWVEAGELDKAASAFAAVPTGHQDGATAAGLAASAGTLPHLKSPGVALGLSVLPGLGQMYSGDWGAGLRNLGLGGALAGGGMMLMNWGHTEDAAWASGMGGALLTTFGVGWSVSAVGAWKRAEKAAAKVRQEHADDVRRRIDELLPALPIDAEAALLTGS